MNAVLYHIDHILGCILGLAFGVVIAAFIKIHWENVKADFSDWNRYRKLRKSLAAEAKKGLHR